MMNFPDSIFAEAAAFEADGVQSISAGATFGGGFREGKNVAGNRRPAPDKCMRTDTNKVVHRAQRADRRPIFDDDVATQCGSVGHDYMISDCAIVSNVRVSHDEVVAADAGESSALYGATIDGDEFANKVVVADFKARGLAVIADILWRESDGRKREEMI